MQVKETAASSGHKAKSTVKGQPSRVTEYESILSIRKLCTYCPSCGIPISKSEGCNKMICSRCGNFFCFNCGQKISGYDHFQQGKCDLFAQRRPDKMAALPRKFLFPNRPRIVEKDGVRIIVKQCPSCRVRVTKEGNNNHVCCWACRHHFCYHCGKEVKNFSQHYVVGGCEQHSSDY